MKLPGWFSSAQVFAMYVLAATTCISSWLNGLY